MPDTGGGSTIAFGTSGAIAATYTKLGGAETSIPSLDMSHLGTTDFAESMPGDFKDTGEEEVEFWANPSTYDSLMTAIGVVQTITKTFPIPSGLTNGATKAGTGYIISVTEPDLVANQLMAGKLKYKFDGGTGPTFTDAS